MAAVVFQTWQAVVLTILCCLSLVLALYCFIFMVPIKRFWERIDSLGGGMEGIEAHVEGVKSEISRRIKAVEEETREGIEAAAACAQKALDALEQLRQEQVSLQAQADRSASEERRLSESLDTLSSELQALRNDLDSLNMELRESMRQSVADAFQQMEGTILSALDAIENEMLRGVEPRGGGPPRPPTLREVTPPRPVVPGRQQDAARGKSQKIISAEPLFAVLEKKSDAHPAGDEPEQEGKEEEAEAARPKGKKKAPRKEKKK